MTSLPAQRLHCPACGKALSLHERFAHGGYCADVPCRHRRLEAQRKAELAAWMRQDRDAAAARVGRPDAALAPIVVVRWYDTPLVPVPAERVEALCTHLMALAPEVDALAAEAAADPAAESGSGSEPASEGVPTAFESPPCADAAEVDALLGQVCARCTGYCCRLGNGRFAFLDADALLRARQRHPGVDHAALVEARLAHVPPLHHAGSCVFHGTQGCTQPREERAAICNSFECPGLEQTRKHAEQDGVRRVYVVRHHEGGGPEGGFAPPYPSTASD